MRGREDAKGRLRSVLMTPAAPEKIRVLSPSWYRKAAEFQGKPESERLVFFVRGAVVLGGGVICVWI